MAIMEALCFPAFQRAAAAVATFELRVRLVADLAPDGTPLQRAALGTDLTPLVEMLCDDYEATADDRAYLKAVANIRNKLFHLELSRVTGRVRPLGEQLKEGGAWMVDLARTSSKAAWCITAPTSEALAARSASSPSRPSVSFA